LFKKITDMADVVRELGRIHEKTQQLNAELGSIVVEGSAGGGMVRVKINGLQNVVDCKIDPEVFKEGDAEMLEDLIVAATNQAMKKVKDAVADRANEILGPAAIGPMANLLRIITK